MKSYHPKLFIFMLTASILSGSFSYALAEEDVPRFINPVGPVIVIDETQQMAPTAIAEPLAITNISVSAMTRSSVQVTWSTNHPTTGTLVFGKKRKPISSQVVSGQPATTHTVIINGLKKKSAYAFRITSQDPETGEHVASAVTNFRTKKK